MKPIDYLINKLFRLSTSRAYAGLKNDCIYYILEQNQNKPFSSLFDVLSALQAYVPTKTAKPLHTAVKAIVEGEILFQRNLV